MEPDILRLAQLFAVIGMFSAGMIGLGWVAKLAFRQPRKQAPSLVPGVDEARFTRLEDAVETIAVEIERISEAQRFSTKLLTERVGERVTSQGAEPEPAHQPSSRA